MSPEVCCRWRSWVEVRWRSMAVRRVVKVLVDHLQPVRNFSLREGNFEVIYAAWRRIILL